MVGIRNVEKANLPICALQVLRTIVRRVVQRAEAAHERAVFERSASDFHHRLRSLNGGDRITLGFALQPFIGK